MTPNYNPTVALSGLDTITKKNLLFLSLHIPSQPPLPVSPHDADAQSDRAPGCGVTITVPAGCLSPDTITDPRSMGVHRQTNPQTPLKDAEGIII